MKRGWVSARDQSTEFGEGTDTARQKALILAEIADSDYLDSLIRVTTALQSFGGRAFIVARRRRLNGAGEIVPHNEIGEYTTLAYLVHYDHENVKGEPEEPEVQFSDVEKLFEEQVVKGNGAEPETAEVTE